MADYFGTDHLISPPITAGPAPSLWQAFSQHLSQQYNVDSEMGLYTEVINRYGNSIRAYEQATGRSAMPTLGSSENVNLFVDDAQGRAPSSWYRNIFTGELSQSYQDKLNQFREVNNWVKQQNRSDLPSMEQVIADVSRMQHGIEAETERQWETSGTGATIAGFLGGAVGSLTPRDPLNLATLPIGGFGKSVVTRLAAEGLVQAGIVGVTDTTAVNPNRQAVGLHPHSTMYDMLLAAAGGVILRGAGEGVAAGVRRFVGETPPLEIHTEGPTNDELRATLDALPDSPKVRAGRSILDAVDDIERVNPYGDSLQGHARFMEELRRVQDQMNGAPETAIARFLPPLPEVPAEHIENNFDFQLVREQQPQLYAKLEEARAKVAGFQEGKTSFERVQASNINPGTNVIKFARGELEGELIWRDGDTEAGVNIYGKGANTSNITELRGILSDIKTEYPELTSIVGSRQSGARVSSPQTVRTSLERVPLTRERRAANKQYKAAYDAVQAEADAIKNRQRIIALANNRKEVGAIVAGGQGRPFPPISLQAAKDIAGVVKAADEAMPERVDALVTKQPDDGTVDIGLEQPVPGDRFFLDEGGQKVTFAKAMADLADDDRTAEAMRTCLL